MSKLDGIEKELLKLYQTHNGNICQIAKQTQLSVQGVRGWFNRRGMKAKGTKTIYNLPKATKKVQLIFKQFYYLSVREKKLEQRRLNRHNTLHAKFIQTKRGKLCMTLRATLYQDVKRGKFGPTMKKLLGKDLPIFKSLPKLKKKPEWFSCEKDIKKCFHYTNLVG